MKNKPFLQCIDSYIYSIRNASGWFRNQAGDAVILPLKELLRDVRTRWDSTFYMLTNFIDMRLVSHGVCYFYLIVSHDFITSGNRYLLKESTLS